MQLKWTLLIYILSLVNQGLCGGNNYFRVSLYDALNLLSRHIDMNGNSCLNLLWLRKRIASVDSHGICVKLYEKNNCKGRSIPVDKATGFVIRDLRKHDFLDATASVGPCYPENSTQISNPFDDPFFSSNHQRPQLNENGRNPAYKVTVFSKQGREYIEGTSCRDFFKSQQSLTKVNSYGTCVKIYEKNKCAGRSVQLNKAIGALSKYGFLGEAKSVGPCSTENQNSTPDYKNNKNPEMLSSTSSGKKEPEQSTPQKIEDSSGTSSDNEQPAYLQLRRK